MTNSYLAAVLMKVAEVYHGETKKAIQEASRRLPGDRRPEPAPSAPAKPTCSTCPHWNQYVVEDRGDCRRFPNPVLKLGKDVCGEHPEMSSKPKPMTCERCNKKAVKVFPPMICTSCGHHQTASD